LGGSMYWDLNLKKQRETKKACCVLRQIFELVWVHEYPKSDLHTVTFLT
jgi:hypothetical protein